MSDTVHAWYFSMSDRRLGFGDGRPIELGTVHTHDGTPVLCGPGLHASERAIDAFKYAPGLVLWRVECGGTVVTGDDKIACTERTYVAGGVDASSLLRAYARWCALSVVHLWACPDVVARYLVTGDETLAVAARVDVWVPVRDAAGGAARAAAWSATRTAAGGAARDAAGAAARAAAWEAEEDEWEAAEDAARECQAAQFEAMCEALIAGDCWWENDNE